MIFYIRDASSNSFGYQIMHIEANNGPQRLMSEGYGFDHIGDMISLIDQLKDSINRNAVAYSRESLGYGYTILNKQGQVLDENFGWTDPEEVKNHISRFKEALNEGVKNLL